MFHGQSDDFTCQGQMEAARNARTWDARECQNVSQCGTYGTRHQGSRSDNGNTACAFFKLVSINRSWLS